MRLLCAGRGNWCYREITWVEEGEEGRQQPVEPDNLILLLRKKESAITNTMKVSTSSLLSNSLPNVLWSATLLPHFYLLHSTTHILAVSVLPVVAMSWETSSPLMSPTSWSMSSRDNNSFIYTRAWSISQVFSHRSRSDTNPPSPTMSSNHRQANPLRIFKALRRSIKGEKEGKAHVSIAPKSALAIVPPKKVRSLIASCADS